MFWALEDALLYDEDVPSDEGGTDKPSDLSDANPVRDLYWLFTWSPASIEVKGCNFVIRGPPCAGLFMR
jgi:hypothetical protein